MYPISLSDGEEADEGDAVGGTVGNERDVVVGYGVSRVIVDEEFVARGDATGAENVSELGDIVG